MSVRRKNGVSKSKLISFDLHVKGSKITLHALLDTGATNNFISSKVLKEMQISPGRSPLNKEIRVRLANGTVVQVPLYTVELHLDYGPYSSKDEYVVLDLDDHMDVVLGMPWLETNEPTIDWKKKSIVEEKSAIAEISICSLIEPDPQSTITEHEAKSDGLTPHVQDGQAHSRSIPESGRESQEVVPVIPLDQEGSFKECLEEPKQTLPKQKGCLRRRQEDDIAFLSSGSSVTGRTVRFACDGDPPDPRATVETVQVYSITETGVAIQSRELHCPPQNAQELVELPVMSWQSIVKDLKSGEIEQLCVITCKDDVDDLAHLGSSQVSFGSSSESSEEGDSSESIEKTRKERFESQNWEAIKDNPLHDIIMEYKCNFPDEPPAELPQDNGIRHEVDLIPGTKYCVTRQWPLPRVQVEAIDAFFESRRKAGQVRESKSPHSSPTFCVKKATGGWRIVHAYNKLNDATIPAQTPIPRKDVIINGMAGSTIFTAIDLKDGYYQILMREKDIPLTAVSTPSGMLWEWLVMPQGLSNAPATFNRFVSHILRSVRDFAPSYFDDIFIHSRAMDGMTALEVHRMHFRRVMEIMKANKLYSNLKKCIFAASEIPVLGCFVGKDGVRPDPEKIRTINEWPVPKTVKELRQFLGLATYLHKYSNNYARIVYPLSQLLKKDQEWQWTEECQEAFLTLKRSLMEAPILALPDPDRPFYVVCDASNFAIGNALMQKDDDGRERVISYCSRQLRGAERNYPVHDKELLSMKYALAKHRVHLLGPEPFIVFTDHASLRTAIKSPHLSQRMARWLSFFSEYNFTVEYKPGRHNVIADALSRRPDLEFKDELQLTAVSVSLSSPFMTLVKDRILLDPILSKVYEYFRDPSDQRKHKLPPHVKSRLHRYVFQDDMLYYRIDQDDNLRIVIPDDTDLKLRIMYEYHDAPASGHLGREKTYLSLSRDFHWPNMYKWVRKYIRACEACQRVKPAPASQAPLQSLAIPIDCWKSVSMDYIYGFPSDPKGNTGILVFVDRFSKMVHLIPVSVNITAEESARIFVDTVFRLHGMPEDFVSDRDPKFTSAFWVETFRLLGTSLNYSTADHPQSDGQTERVNRVLLDILRSYATTFPHWSDFLPMVEFAINNAVHASTGQTPFYVNGLRHPRLPHLLHGVCPPLSGGENQDSNPDSNIKAQAAVDFVLHRQTVLRFVRDALANAVDIQKMNADAKGRRNLEEFSVGDLVLLSTDNLKDNVVSNLGSHKLLPKYIGPYKVIQCNGHAYTLNMPTSMRLHPTFYVGRLKRYHRFSSSVSEVIDPSTHPVVEGDLESGDNPPLECSTSSAPQQEPDSSEGFVPSSQRVVPEVEHDDTSPLRDLSPTVESQSVGKQPLQEKQMIEKIQGQKPSVSKNNVDRPLMVRNDPIPDRILPPPPAPLIDNQGNMLWIVESLIDHRHKGSRPCVQNREFLVHWLGYPPSSRTWEPRKNLLVDIPDMVHEYEKAHELKK